MAAVRRAATLTVVCFAKKCVGVSLKITTEIKNCFSKHYEGFTFQRKRCLFTDSSSLCSLCSDAVNDSDHAASYVWMIVHKERKLREEGLVVWFKSLPYAFPCRE